MYLSGALTAGPHTISIRPRWTKPVSSSNAWVSIDNWIGVATVTKQETSLRQNFRLVSAASAYGGSYDTMTQATATARLRLATS